MSGNQLIKVNELDGALVPQMDAMDAVAASSFLPQLKVGGASSDPVKEGQVQMGAYFLKNGDSIDDLGKEIDIIPVTWQPKALDYSDRTNIISTTDHTSELFAEIKTRSGVQNSDCLSGPEFLVYLKDQKKFATLYMCSTSQKKLGPRLAEMLGQAVTCKTKLAKNNKGSWHVPVFVECPTPMTPPNDVELKDALTKFRAAPDGDTPEVVKEEGTRER